MFGHRSSLLEFRGVEHEYTEAYVTLCTEYFTASDTPDNQRTRVIEPGLKNEAKRWWLEHVSNRNYTVQEPRWHSWLRTLLYTKRPGFDSRARHD